MVYFRVQKAYFPPPYAQEGGLVNDFDRNRWTGGGSRERQVSQAVRGDFTKAGGMRCKVPHHMAGRAHKPQGGAKKGDE